MEISDLWNFLTRMQRGPELHRYSCSKADRDRIARASLRRWTSDVKWWRHQVIASPAWDHRRRKDVLKVNANCFDSRVCCLWAWHIHAHSHPRNGCARVCACVRSSWKRCHNMNFLMNSAKAQCVQDIFLPYSILRNLIMKEVEREFKFPGVPWCKLEMERTYIFIIREWFHFFLNIREYEYCNPTAQVLVLYNLWML